MELQIGEKRGFPIEWEERLAAALPHFLGLHSISMPPNWKQDEPVRFNYVILGEEPNADEFMRFFELCERLNIPNPRPIGPRHLELASLFHPLFHGRLMEEREGGSEALRSFLDTMARLQIRIPIQAALPVSSPKYYLQSLIFLAGVTLSSAIVQRRFSESSIESKLNRLWQIAQYASYYASPYRLADVEKLDIATFVRDFAVKIHDGTDIPHLIELKKFYGKVAAALNQGLAARPMKVLPADLTPEQKSRFGFTDRFRKVLGDNLQCLFVYGSSVDSRRFGDYDIIVLVQDERSALEQFAGSDPEFHGKELNMALYDTADFSHFQALAGDNLHHNGICLYGEAFTQAKPAEDLLARNFSFGYIRLRQLLGLAAAMAKNNGRQGANQKERSPTLFEYFIKIPLHVTKGVYSALGAPPSKETLSAWAKSRHGYSIHRQMHLLRDGRFLEVVAEAYLATLHVLEDLNARYGVYGVLGQGTGPSPAPA